MLATQRPDELAEFIRLLRRENVRSYLEIGLRRGETFEAVANQLPLSSLVVGVDWPRRMGGVWEPYEEGAVMEVFDRLGDEYHKRLVLGSSRSQAVIDAVDDYEHYDAVLIDADHTYDGVKADWLNYGPMARIVAFHDIDAANWDLMQKRPDKLKRHGVRQLWDEIRVDYRHVEIIGAEPGMGIGVLWRE